MTKILNIEGMSCHHCVNAVKEELEKITGIDKVEVNLENKNAAVTIALDSVTDEDLAHAIEEAGYELVSIE